MGYHNNGVPLEFASLMSRNVALGPSESGQGTPFTNNVCSLNFDIQLNIKVMFI